MQVLIGNNEYVDLDKCKFVIKGTDGTVYVHGDIVIKICHSKFMTYGKFEDYRKVVEQCEEKGEDFSKKHIILPSEIANDPKKKIKRLAINPLFGYTQPYKVERDDGLSLLTTKEFINSIEKLRSEVHDLFSTNNISITDPNPKNLLVSDTGEIFLIDHDRNITPSSMISKKRIYYVEDPFRYNECRLSEIVNKALTLEAFRGVKMNKSNKRKKIGIMRQQSFIFLPLEAIYDILCKYDTISDYANDKAIELKLKKN